MSDELETLAADTLRLARNTLLVNLRFMDAAISRLELISNPDANFATDGRLLLYTPKYVLKRYMQEKETVTRDYLHMLFHCIFRHMYVHTLVNQACWNLACDIAVEYSISGLGLKSARVTREVLQEEIFKDLADHKVMLTAEKIYRYYLDQNLPPQKIAYLRGAFYSDEHKIWYLSEEEKAEQYRLGTGGKQKKIGVLMPGTGSGNGEAADLTELDGVLVPAGSLSTGAQEADWKDVAERLQMDLETFSMKQGRDAGNLIQNLKEVNREKYDYTAFLKKFAVLGEALKINDDEFDYIYYTYGLNLYGKVPLIEPLEYKDVKRIKEFVIAIDTSGSTSGELVQTFLNKTYNILKSTENFFSKINIHIIQCDATIQEDAKITSQEEFDNYLSQMKIHGLGGTDFRPVFGYVDYLREKKEFSNLKGLIYFTDGYGTFPEKKPPYETAFVFIDDEYNNPDVPPWAIKLLLRKDEI